MRLTEFRPALRFLGVFLGLYITLNLAYGIWIESLGAQPDSLTFTVSRQASYLLKIIGYEVDVQKSVKGPTVDLKDKNITIVEVFEGCNGINVSIVFASFIIAFGGTIRGWLWYIPAGILIIHLFNLIRITLLFGLAVQQSRYFYYFHKYLFTAVIYAAILGLWWVWIKYFNQINGKGA